MTEKKTIIQINNAGKTFFYNGKIISEDDKFIEFEDQKEGRLKINRDVIILIKEVQS